MNRPMLLATIILSMGIILAYYLFSSVVPFLASVSLMLRLVTFILLFIISLSIIFIKYRNDCPYIFYILSLCTIFLIGFTIMSWYQINYHSSFSVASFNGLSKVTVIGEVKEDLRSLEGNKIYIKPIMIERNKVNFGLIQLDKRFLPVELKNGDFIKINLSLVEPRKQLNPGGFSSYKYLKRRGIYSKGYYKGKLEFIDNLTHPVLNTIIKLKYRFINIINITTPYPYNELFKALLLGERNKLPDKWDQDFTRAGVNHLLAISGLHVGFILLIFIQFFKILHLPETIRNFLITFLMIIYIILSGLRPSVFRAGLLTIAFLWAPFFDRKADIINILGLTAFLNLLINPYQLFAVGFQLTYFVLLMIILWHKILKKYISISPLLSISISAQLGSTPIIIYYFNLITPISIVTNIWAIPLVGFIVSVSLIGLVLGLMHPIFTLVIGKILIYPVKILIMGIGLMADIPGSHIEVATPPPIFVFYWILLLIVLPVVLRKRILPFNETRRKKRLYYITLITLIIIAFYILLPIFNNKLEITFIAIGQGDSILIKSRRNRYFLIDGGGYAGPDISQGQLTLLPYLRYKGIKKLDIVFITHFDADHARGIIDVLKKREVRVLILPANYEDNDLARKVINVATDKGIPVKLTEAGDYYQNGQLSMLVLNPDADKKNVSRNENSIVLKLTYKKFSLLLTGDLEIKGEEDLINSNYDLDCEVIKFGHHGSSGSSSIKFLRYVSPHEGIISVGKNNYGHPSHELLKRVNDLNIKIWRTDKNGAIIIRTDGISYKIEGYLKNTK